MDACIVYILNTKCSVNTATAKLWS